MLYGYARVSSKQQDLQAQLNQLNEYGCEIIFREKASGRNIKNRAEFEKLLRTVQPGDTIVVSKLDRFARSTIDGLTTIKELTEEGVYLVILDMGAMRLDTSTPTGKFTASMLSVFAEFEADMIRARQREGIALAKERGAYKGRTKKYHQNHKGLQHALELYFNRDLNKQTVNDIAQITSISVATIYREARKARETGVEEVYRNGESHILGLAQRSPKND